MSSGQAKNGPRTGPRTARGRVSIINANVINGARCFVPVLEGESGTAWHALLDGIRSRIEPADRLEEEMTCNLALSFWQALRLHRYERAATHREMVDAAKDENLFGHSDAM